MSIKLPNNNTSKVRLSGFQPGVFSTLNKHLTLKEGRSGYSEYPVKHGTSSQATRAEAEKHTHRLPPPPPHRLNANEVVLHDSPQRWEEHRAMIPHRPRHPKLCSFTITETVSSSTNWGSCHLSWLGNSQVQDPGSTLKAKAGLDSYHPPAIGTGSRHLFPDRLSKCAFYKPIWKGKHQSNGHQSKPGWR